MTRLLADLCAGTGGWQAPFTDDSDWEVVGLDTRPVPGADLVADVRSLPLDCRPDLLCMSPPCPQFSTAPNTPFAERDIDRSVWGGCWKAVCELEPHWWVIENVAGAQAWWGESDKCCHPYHLWGRFPPFDVGEMPSKQQGADFVENPEQAARIPYHLARSLKLAVEVWT